MLYCCTIAKILNLNWINIFERIRFLPDEAPTPAVMFMRLKDETTPKRKRDDDAE